ncbi:unnamed protein product [Rhizophagus irregularis]|nr:unnamed protein product [Rhizophagus irregularis]
MDFECETYVTNCNGTTIWGPTHHECSGACKAIEWDSAPDFYCLHTFRNFHHKDNPYVVAWKKDLCLWAYVFYDKIEFYEVDCSEDRNNPTCGSP